MLERYISALVMHFKPKVLFRAIVLKLTAVLILYLLSMPAYGGIIDRVVAFIDDQAITLRDFQQYYRLASRFHKGLTPEKAIETLINRLIILREAYRMKLKGSSDDELINTYIDIKIRAFVRVSEDEIIRFYRANRERLGGVALDDVRDQIETLLREKKVNSLLKRHLRRLKQGSYIKVNYIPES